MNNCSIVWDYRKKKATFNFCILFFVLRCSRTHKIDDILLVQFNTFTQKPDWKEEEEEEEKSSNQLGLDWEKGERKRRKRMDRNRNRYSDLWQSIVQPRKRNSPSLNSSSFPFIFSLLLFFLSLLLELLKRLSLLWKENCLYETSSSAHYYFFSQHNRTCFAFALLTFYLFLLFEIVSDSLPNWMLFTSIVPFKLPQKKTYFFIFGFFRICKKRIDSFFTFFHFNFFFLFLFFIMDFFNFSYIFSKQEEIFSILSFFHTFFNSKTWNFFIWKYEFGTFLERKFWRKMI